MNLDQPEENALDIARLLRQIRRGSPETCRRAKAELEQAGAQAVGPLLRRFNAESRRYQRSERNFIRIGIAGSFLVTLVDVISILIAAQRGVDTFPFLVITGMWLLYLLCLGVAVVPLQRSSATRHFLREILARYDDVRVVGPLAEMLSVSEPDLRKEAGRALIHLLPHLTASDAPLLTAEQRECLYSVLRGGARDELDLRVAILRALQQVGDSTALPLVERLAEMSSRRQWRVRDAARDCLPYLRLRAQQEQSDRTLLRASSAFADTPDALLHPAAHSEQNTPQQLLRPTTEQTH